MSLQRQKWAAELLSELENVLCPIVSTPFFRFQATTRAEGTISSISHLADSESEWLGFSLAYEWGTGSKTSSCWDWNLDIRKDLRAWPGIKSKDLNWEATECKGKIRCLALPWIRDVLRSFCPCVLQNRFLPENVCFSRTVLDRAHCTPSSPTPAHVQRVKSFTWGEGTQHPI